MNRTQNLEWEDLLAKARIGNSSVVNQLLEKLAVTLRPILQYRLRGWSREDLDDVLQETLITFAQKIDRIESNPHHYAYTILRNKIGDALRIHQAHRKIAFDDPKTVSPSLYAEIEQILKLHQTHTDVQTQVENEEVLESIRQALKRLSLFCQVFFLGVLEHRSMEEMWTRFKASQPDLQRGAFRKRIFDCRMKLKEILQIEV